MLPYRVYTAKISQSGAGQPVSTVMKDDLAATTNVWTRFGPGEYELPTLEPYDASKVYIEGFDGESNQNVWRVEYGAGNPVTNPPFKYNMYCYDSGGLLTIGLSVADVDTSVATDLSAFLAGGVIALPDVRIYP